MRKIREKYVMKNEGIKKERKEISRKINKLKEKEKNIKDISWVDELLVPLAGELAKEFDKDYDIYGPFGMRASTTIYLMDDKEKGIVEQPTLGLTIIPGNLSVGELFYETGETTTDYPKGTIGHLNGMNNVEKALPEKFEDIIKLVK